MQALWYLVGRQLVNSLRRTLRHPLRLAVFLLVVGWFGFLIWSSLFFTVGVQMREAPPSPADLQLISRDSLLALIIAAHLGILWYPLTPWIGFTTVPLFTPADVHFLFPSPQRRLRVFFFLLLVRGFANSLFLLLALLLLVPALGHELIASVLTGRPLSHLVYVWAYPLMYLLAFVGLLLCGTWIALKEEQREGFRRLVAMGFWSVAGVLAGMLGMYAYRAWREGYEPLQEVVWHVLHNPMVAVPLTPLRALAEAALAFYGGWTPYVTLGFLLWGGLAGGMFWLLARQEGWLYELAARMSSWTTVHLLRRQNPAQAAYTDTVSYLASLGQAIPRWSLFERWVPQGVWALLWCHSLILWRMVRGMRFSWGVFLTVVGVMLVVVLRSVRAEREVYSVVGGLVLYLSAFFDLFFAQIVLGVAVRRVEMSKALPFTTRQIVWMEILPLSLFVWGALAVLWGVFCVLSLPHWHQLTAHFLQVVSLVLLWHAGLLMLYLLVPDQSDYTQRVLFGVLFFPVLFLTTLPTLALWSAGMWLSLPPLVTAGVVVAGNALAAELVVRVAAERYARLNPAE
ncbi:MAG: putative ABC exporter domain-containing protein [Armatimonadota bacterium]|nr:putative ABC exporter domain-containing protein [Armatimonadota bacterium]